jgi:hypothetical protein
MSISLFYQLVKRGKDATSAFDAWVLNALVSWFIHPIKCWTMRSSHLDDDAIKII